MDESSRSEVREPKLWYAVLARGCLAVLFALVAIPHRWEGVRGLAKLFALYALLDAVIALYEAIRVRRTHTGPRGGVLAVEGLAGLAAAVLAFTFPAVTPLRIVGGLRGVVLGAAEVGRSRGGRTNDLLELGGIAAVVLGVIVLGWPGPADVALAWLLGLLSLVSGALTFAGALSHFRGEEVLSSPPPG